MTITHKHLSIWLSIILMAALCTTLTGCNWEAVGGVTSINIYIPMGWGGNAGILDLFQGSSTTGSVSNDNANNVPITPDAPIGGV